MLNRPDIQLPTIDELQQWDRWHLWHAFTQMSEYEPLIIESAEGIWLTDIDGNRYLDGVSSLWCNVHGHRNAALDDAIGQQLKRVSHVTLLGSSSSTSVRLARKLAELAPGDLNHVFFGSDGASAVEAALKIAFQYWRQKTHPERRDRFMALEFAYHGDTIGSVSLGGIAQFHALFRPLLFDAIRLPCPDQDSVPSDSTATAAVEMFTDKMRPIFERHHRETAAVIVEPLIQGAAGMIVHPPGMLRAIRELCDEFDVLLIADEVATGFGRTGSMFACEQESVVPDIMCLGKGLTGGYLPLSATIARTKIWEAFLGTAQDKKALYHGHTFGGNPLAAAVALANIELFESEDLLAAMQPTITRMSERLEAIKNHSRVRATRGIGLMGGIEIGVNDHQIGAAVCQRARQRKVLLRPLGNVVVVMPPLIAQPSDIDLIFDAVTYGLDAG